MGACLIWKEEYVGKSITWLLEEKERLENQLSEDIERLNYINTSINLEKSNS